MPTGVGRLTRGHLDAWFASMNDALVPATIARHDCSAQRLFRGLVEDGELLRLPGDGMRAPAVPEQLVDILTDDVSALLAAVKGNTGREPPGHRPAADARRHRHACGRAARGATLLRRAQGVNVGRLP